MLAYNTERYIGAETLPDGFPAAAHRASVLEIVLNKGGIVEQLDAGGEGEGLLRG